MYRPSLYEKHDETMNNFANLFNSVENDSHIEMIPNPFETYDNDGIFIDVQKNLKIGYDWEYRDRYFENCKLQFETLGQYERKLRKPSIQIALQCDSTETGIAVAWHSDWFIENRENRALKTDYNKKEQGTTRYTKNFEIYSYKQLSEFKHMISMAMRLNLYSSKIFEYIKINS